MSPWPPAPRHRRRPDHHVTSAPLRALLCAHPPRALTSISPPLCASSPESGRAVERLAERTALTITLHYVPHASTCAQPTAPHRCYALVAESARGVVVNSPHEAARSPRPASSPESSVVPLPVAPRHPARVRDRAHRTSPCSASSIPERHLKVARAIATLPNRRASRAARASAATMPTCGLHRATPQERDRRRDRYVPQSSSPAAGGHRPRVAHRHISASARSRPVSRPAAALSSSTTDTPGDSRAAAGPHAPRRP